MVLSDIPINARPAAKPLSPDEKKPSSPRDWRSSGKRTERASPNKANPVVWGSFSSCSKKAERDAAKKAATPPKGSHLVQKEVATPPTTKTRHHRGFTLKSKGSRPKLQVSSGGYRPPHLRFKEQQLALIEQQAEPRAKAPKTLTPAKVTFGPLKAAARDIFERAHGLNGVDQEEMAVLQKNTMAKFGCSEKAFMSLVLGHSYNEELATLRGQVPGYVTKEEARRLRNAVRKAKKKAARSCHSSPSTLPLPAPETWQPSDSFDLAASPVAEEPQQLDLSELSLEESFGTPSLSPTEDPPQEEYHEQEQKHHRIRKARSRTEPTDTLEQHGGVGTWRDTPYCPSDDSDEEDAPVPEADQDLKPLDCRTLLSALFSGADR